MTMTIGFDTLIDTHEGGGLVQFLIPAPLRFFQLGRNVGTEFLASLQRPQMILFIYLFLNRKKKKNGKEFSKKVFFGKENLKTRKIPKLILFWGRGGMDE